MNAVGARDRVCVYCRRSLVGCRRVNTAPNGSATYARECTGQSVGPGVERPEDRRCYLPWVGDVKPVFAGEDGEPLWLALTAASGDFATTINALYAIARQLQEFEIGENNARVAASPSAVPHRVCWNCRNVEHPDTALLT